jgi:hypothetical protein
LGTRCKENPRTLMFIYTPNQNTIQHRKERCYQHWSDVPRHLVIRRALERKSSTSRTPSNATGRVRTTSGMLYIRKRRQNQKIKSPQLQLYSLTNRTYLTESAGL